MALGAGLFWLAIKDAPVTKIIEEFKKANYFWIGLSIIVMVLSHWFRALRWNLLINTLNFNPKTRITFFAVMVGYFANLAVPRLGEVTRCGVLSKHEKMPINSVIGTVIAERTFDMITLLFIILITILAQLDFLGDFMYKHIVDPLLSKFPSGTVAIITLSFIFIALVGMTILAYKLLRPKIRHTKFYQKFRDIVLGFWTGIKTIKNVKSKKTFLFYSLLLWASYLFTIYICFQAMTETSGLSVMDALTILAIGSIGVLAPTPGGIGAYQYMVGLSLTGLFLVDKIPAYSFANIIYFAQWIMIVLLGGTAWLWLVISEKRKKNEQIRTGK